VTAPKHKKAPAPGAGKIAPSTSSRASHPALPYAVLAAGVLIVSSASVLIRFAQGLGVPSLSLAAWRLTLAALILTPLVLTRAREELATLTSRDVMSRPSRTERMWFSMARCSRSTPFGTPVEPDEYCTVAIPFGAPSSGDPPGSVPIPAGVRTGIPPRTSTALEASRAATSSAQQRTRGRAVSRMARTRVT